MADKQELLQSILGLIKDDDKPEAKSLLETAVGAVAGGASSGGGGNIVTGILGSLMGGDKDGDNGPSFDVGGLISGLIGGEGKEHASAAEGDKPNVLMELLPKIISMVKPEDLGKVKDLLVGLLSK